MASTFAEFRIKRVDPALSAGLVIPTYASTVNVSVSGGKANIKHTRHRFRDMFPTYLSTAYTSVSMWVRRYWQEWQTPTSSDGFYQFLILFRRPWCKPRRGHDW